MAWVVGWDREALPGIMTACPRIAIDLSGAVVERLNDIQDRCLELRAKRVEQRIARSLLRIMKKSGRIFFATASLVCACAKTHHFSSIYVKSSDDKFNDVNQASQIGKAIFNR